MFKYIKNLIEKEAPLNPTATEPQPSTAQHSGVHNKRKSKSNKTEAKVWAKSEHEDQYFRRHVLAHVGIHICIDIQGVCLYLLLCVFNALFVAPGKGEKAPWNIIEIPHILLNSCRILDHT